MTELCSLSGLSLTRHYSCSEEVRANPSSITRQKSYDFNEIQDRNYQYFAATNDDGWLAGGGEHSHSYKLPNPDSAHCEILRIGCLESALGGVDECDIVTAMSSGQILIPHMAITPSFVLQNKDSPPEFELKFELEPPSPSLTHSSLPVDQWPNWQLEFLHNQLFNYFQFPGRFCPGPFHMTFVRKAAFRSPEHRVEYMRKCSEAVARWRELGPQLLTPECDPNQEGYPGENVLDNELTHPHGVYLFRHRMLPTKYFAPNFEPPYDTAEKREIIAKVLGRKWDEHDRVWKNRSEM